MPITKAEAQDVTEAFLRDYPGALKLAYKFREDVAELYEYRSAEVSKDMKGAYVLKATMHEGRIYRGRVDVPLQNIDNATDLLWTLRHEVLGHYGVNTFTSAEKRALLDGLIAAREDPIIKLLWDNIDHYYDGHSLDVRAEEVFALHCEGIEPSHHRVVEQVEQRGHQSFLETCIARVRPMQADDLQNIACMVAQGLRDRSRTQQNFPQINESFRKDEAMEPKKPFYEIVAEKLIEQLKAGTAPWQKPWEPGEPNTLLPMNPTTGKRYKGINAIHLMAQGRSDMRWMTYKQAADVGAQVRKSEKGIAVQYWEFREERDKLDHNGKPVLDGQGKPVKETVMLERPRTFFSTVFNGEQIDGLLAIERKPQAWNAVDRAEHILSGSGATIRHGENDSAFYLPRADRIHLPNKGQFPSADRYYATALHELGHWTGHSSRLDRDLLHPFGSEGYAKEELRAEIASMILGDELGIGHDPEQHAAYVGSWITALENNPLEIFRAAADAEKIQKYVLAFEQTQIQEQAQTSQQSQEIAQQQEQEVRMRREDSTDKSERIYINVSYSEKNEAKAFGARWDRQEQSWYIPPGADAASFAKWTQQPAQDAVQAPRQISASQTQEQKPVQDRVYLAVAFGERGAAKAVGAQWDKTMKNWYAGPKADMDKLQRWLPGNVQSQQDPAMTPRQEFSEALKSLGCVVTGEHPVMDGKNHRIGVEGDKKGEQAGFYVGHLDGLPAGYIKNNRTGIEMKWKLKGYALDPQEKAGLQAEAAGKLAARTVEQERQQEAAAQRVSRQTESLKPVSEPTSYMQAKGIQPHAGALTDAEGQKTYIPATDATGKQWTTQYIAEDGTKRFAKGSRKEGCFHAVGGIEAVASAPALVIAEGYATAATLAETLGHGTVAAFDSGNLAAVARALHEKFPEKPVVIAGDDDRYLEATQGINPGKTKAQQAARTVGGKAVFPVFSPGEAVYPADLEPVTPQTYREHLRVTKALDEQPALTDEARSALRRSQLSDKQLAALDAMKRHSDFNDLNTKSELGRAGVERQVRAVVGKAIEDAGRKREQHQEQRQEQKQRRAVRIG